MPIHFGNSMNHMSSEEADNKAKLLNIISGGNFHPFIRNSPSGDPNTKYWSFKGKVLGFDVSVWIDTGDWLWHATSTVNNSVINCWSYSFQDSMRNFMLSLKYELESMINRINQLESR